MRAKDIDLLEAHWVRKSRVNFYAFRQFVGSNDFKRGHFQKDISEALQQFVADLRDNKKPILILEAPPQHGKSRAVAEVIAWIMGKLPDLATIFASYSERLGVRTNRYLQRIIDSEKYQKIFPDTKLGGSNVVTLANKVLRNNEIIEIVGHTGSFRQTTVNGAVTGEGLDLGVIDDPVKGRAEANSKTIQDKTWDWFTDDFYTRFSENAGLLLILTRWNKVDLAERLKKDDPNVKTVTFKAIAEKDEEHRKAGEPLFPEHKSLEFLMKRKNKMAEANWLSVYQQSPIVKGGNIFKYDQWRWWTSLPEIECLFMVGDTASKKNNWNDFTSLQVWAYGVDHNIYLIDMIHKRMESHELRQTATIMYNKHNAGKLILPEGCRSSQADQQALEEADPYFKGEKVRIPFRKIYIEDKSSGIGLVQDLRLKQIKVEPIPRNTDKIARAYDAQPEIEVGKVHLCEHVPYVEYITDQGLEFPNGAYDDDIDAVMLAIEVAFIIGLGGPGIRVI